MIAGSLIWVLLEGTHSNVRECLARWRTRSVDVNSKGRWVLSWFLCRLVRCLVWLLVSYRVPKPF